MADDLIAHIWDMSHRLENEKDRHTIIALSDLVPVLENRIEALEKAIVDWCDAIVEWEGVDFVERIEDDKSRALIEAILDAHFELQEKKDD